MTWYRYIDDIFVVWEGSLELLQELMDRLNDNTYSLSFTYSYHQKEIFFLYIMVKVDENRNLTSGLYRKPTADNTLLRYNSVHPMPLKRSIPFAQYLRLRRLCSMVG